MAVYSYLDLSTRHITREDSGLLDTDADEGRALVVEKYDEGYWIYVPPSSDEWLDTLCEMRVAGYSYDLQRIMLVAFKSGNRKLRLDTDGDMDERFPTHDW